MTDTIIDKREKSKVEKLYMTHDGSAAAAAVDPPPPPPSRPSPPQYIDANGL